ncbi:alpha-2-macroglobulin family protein [Prolixibacter denitrificans]|uniref:Uncharacterized protein YfaS (Alpha-2-macroglobulin family) n=1 Tax=Prolixibacter denitrificans TaxID=1541063 RepID=A0A2P8CGA9_9BACT|nr:alpha-2-macroglobulin family protein [Prolixibacter denitrificans]PSK84025.1 uncharacterized protein YfaS (alpha-2-macroglobulin family) [Prolixibacter denitrificans]GET23567.1 hypothetical protein JCM18694_38130 [Prolixibacter denitrificans]
MKMICRLLLALLLFSLFSTTQAAIPQFSYREKWAEADSLAHIRKPESVKKVIKQIVARATKENNIPQRVKAFTALQFFAVKDSLPKNPVPIWQNEYEKLNVPGRAVVKAYEGSYLLQIYRDNRWKILDRASGGVDSTDINTWDAGYFVEQIHRCFNEALQHPDSLSKIPAKNWQSLVIDKKVAWERTPTLLDLIVRKALNFYQDGSLFTQPVRRPSPSLQNAALSLRKPGGVIIDRKTPLNFYDHSIILYRLLERYHQQDGDSVALFYARLNRIKFTYGESSLENADRLFLDEIHGLEKTVAHSYLLADVWEAEADFYQMRGGEFRENVPQTAEHRLDWLKAARLYENTWEKFPKTEAGKRSFNSLQQLKRPQLSTQSEAVVRPGFPFAIKLDYQNLKSVKVSIHKINQKLFRTYFLQYGQLKSREDSSKLLGSPVIQREKYTLVPDSDLRSHSTELLLKPLEAGVYVLQIDGDGCESLFPLAVSRIYIEQERVDAGTIFSVRRQSNGEAVAGAELSIRNLNGKKLNKTSLKTNDKGRAFWSGDGNLVQISSSTDTLSLRWRKPYYGKQTETTKEKTWFFTDRSIYRPGQVVLFKAITFKTHGDTARAVAGKPMVVFLRDAHNQVIDSLRILTDRFGSTTGQFRLPAGSLAGNFTLRTSEGYQSFRVEAYRRPGFHITFDKFDGQYEAGHPVTVTGRVKSFNGVPLAGVPGMYKITRHTLWFERSGNNSEDVISGMFTTDTDGRFRFTFTPKSTENDYGLSYQIETEVTDISGETQTTEQSLSISQKALFAQLSAPGQVDASDKGIRKGKGIKVGVKFNNSANQVVPVKGTVTFARLQTPDQAVRERVWKAPDRPIYTKEQWEKQYPGNVYGDEVKPEDFPVEKVLSTQKFNTAERSWCFLPGKKLKPGYYKVTVETEDAFGQNVTGERVIRVFRSKCRKYPFADPFHVNLNKTTVKPGDDLKLELGTAGEAFWQVALEEPDTLIQLPAVKTKKSRQQVVIPVTSDMANGFAVRVSTIQHGRSFRKLFRINVMQPNKKLQVTAVDFPSTAEPGKEVSWKIRVTDERGKPAQAEVAGVVYDASLDDIRMHNWSLSLFNHWFYVRQMPLMIRPVQTDYAHSPNTPLQKVETEMVPELGLPKWVNTSPGGAVFFVADEKVPVGEQAANESIRIRGASAAPKVEEPKIRSDFRETAWFGPQLKTDANGMATVHFRMPDALTKWKFMALAHTVNGKTGTTDTSFVSQKPLMVEPYPVRFLVAGDQVELPVKVTNLSGKELEADIHLNLIAVDSNDTLEPGFEPRHIGLENGESGVVKWLVQAPEKAGLYRIQVVGSAGNLSDGYEKTIQVLPAKQWMVQSETFQVKPGGVKVWSPLFPEGGQVNDKWTLEWMGNPVWQAIEALPSVLSSRPQSATGLANRLYAYATVQQILARHPEIAAELAKQRAKLLNNPDSFKTRMEQNDDLANIQLNETPWLDDAIRAKKQLQLFVPDTIAVNITDDLSRLKAMQHEDGGFSWYPEMKASPWITMQVVDQLSALEKANALKGEEKTLVDTMLVKAMHYLETEMLATYKRLTEKQRVQYIPSANIVDYLYVCSGSKIKPAGKEVMAAYRFFIQSVSKNWMKLSLYQQAQSASILWLTNDRKTAQTIIESLKERAAKSKKLGMHWRTNNSPWFYRESSLSLQAIMMQLFEKTGAPETDLAAMKLWLLQQKRTHAWSTPDETVKAVEALLLAGSGANMETSGPTVLLNGKPLTSSISGTPKGYFKYTLPSGLPENSTLELRNNGKTTGFGALYHQFFAPVDSSLSTGNGIKVTKSLYRVIRRNGGESLSSDLKGLKPGDLIMVRLRIHTHRDLGFVSISDARPAGTEPVKQLSGYESSGRLWYYRVNTDEQTRFFIQELKQGDYLLEYPVRVSHRGDFSSGRVTIQCQFAPAFNASDTAGEVIIEK